MHWEVVPFDNGGGKKGLPLVQFCRSVSGKASGLRQPRASAPLDSERLGVSVCTDSRVHGEVGKKSVATLSFVFRFPKLVAFTHVNLYSQTSAGAHRRSHKHSCFLK